MALTRVIMPKTGADMEEGRILLWKKKEGDRVSKGEILLEIETDKATMEVESPEAGVVLRQFFVEGAVVPATRLIAVLGEGHESPEEITGMVLEGEGSPAVPAASSSPVLEAGPAAPRTNTGGRIPASPLARKLAQEMGIDLANVQGSGPDGRIEKDDVLMSAEAKKTAALPAGEAMVLSPMRRAIARRVARSKQEIPEFSVTMAMDMSAALRKKRELQLSGKDVSISDLLIFAVAHVLPSHPSLNAEFKGDSLVQHREINIGFAVGTADGLYIPVVRNANQLSVEEVAGETRRLSARAEQRQITEADMGGGTFTISNLGMFGVDSFTAIVVPPQTGILAVGRLEERPVRGDDGALTWRPEMSVTLTVDHRALDGLAAARFLAGLRDFLSSL